MAKEFTRADGSVLKSGLMSSAKRKTDAKKYKSMSSSLPAKVDLRSQMTPIEDQGQIGSCVANSTAGAVEHLINVTQGVHYDVSRLFIYYNSRKYHHDEDKDSGTMEETAVKSLQEYGVCSESTWPYEDTLDALTTKPNKNAYNEAKNFKIKEFQSVEVDLNTWKSALAEGHPIIFGMSLFDSFDRQKRPGLVPMPSAKERSRESHSGHSMLCVGYSDPDRLFIVRNSWGTSWGDDGYCYIPYDYMMNTEFNDTDGWVLYSADPIDTTKIQEETWSEDEEESIVPDIDTAFSEMDDETWEALCDACGDYDVLYRIGGLYVAAAIMDEEFGDDEKNMAAEKLKNLLKYFGAKMNPKKVLKNCMELVEDEEFLTSSMEIFAEYLPDSLKLYILNDMMEIAGADGLDEAEEGFINDMAEIFNIAEGTEAMEFDDDYDDDWDYDDEDDENWNWDDDDEEYDEDDEEYDDDDDEEYDEDDEDDEEYDEDDEEYDEDDEEYDEDDEDFDEDDEEYDEDDEEYDDEDDEDFDEDDEEYDDDEDGEYDEEEDE